MHKPGEVFETRFDKKQSDKTLVLKHHRGFQKKKTTSQRKISQTNLKNNLFEEGIDVPVNKVSTCWDSRFSSCTRDWLEDGAWLPGGGAARTPSWRAVFRTTEQGDANTEERGAKQLLHTSQEIELISKPTLLTP
jgi:hypothetical protein